MRPLTSVHLATLREYVVRAESPHDWTFPGAVEVLGLAERVAAYIEGAPAASAEHGAALLRVEDAELLTTVGKLLVLTATPLLGKRSDAGTRLALGQALLDTRDALQSALIDAGALPERRRDVPAGDAAGWPGRSTAPVEG